MFMMKKYANGVSEFKFAAIFMNIVFLGVTLIRIINFNQGDDFYGFIAMVVVLPTCALLIDFVIFYLRKQFYTTYYNDIMIEQKFLFKRKSINLSDINHIIIVGNVIVLSKNIIDISSIPNKVGKSLNYLSDNVLISLGRSDIILCLISQNKDVKVDYIKPTKQMSIRIKDFFTII